MKKATILFVVALTVGIGQLASGGGDHDHGTSDKKQSKRDQLQIAVQKICPVSGEKLGDHGAPIKVKVGKEKVFLCCKACLKGKVDKKHWKTIHANFAEAQGKCPVMKKALPKNPKWTIVDGKVVYVCCPPCTKKIAADPKTYLRKVDEYYTASLQSKRSRR